MTTTSEAPSVWVLLLKQPLALLATSRAVSANALLVTGRTVR
jgi:hypothetical protein